MEKSGPQNPPRVEGSVRLFFQVPRVKSSILPLSGRKKIISRKIAKKIKDQYWDSILKMEKKIIDLKKDNYLIGYK